MRKTPPIKVEPVKHFGVSKPHGTKFQMTCGDLVLIIRCNLANMRTDYCGYATIGDRDWDVVFSIGSRRRPLSNSQRKQIMLTFFKKLLKTGKMLRYINQKPGERLSITLYTRR